MAAEIITIKAPCNECCRDTDHIVLKSHKTFGSEPDGSGWSTTFDMIECYGCHFISLKRTFDFTEYDGLVIKYFPPPISRRKPAWYGELAMNIPVELELIGLLDEVYSALHANNRRLATMGARALLDMAITDKVKDVGRFDQKLDALEKEGFISKRQREFLEAALDAGNAASHRGHCPSAKELDQVMDIVESVLQQIYVLPQTAADLKKSTPQRNKVAKIT